MTKPAHTIVATCLVGLYFAGCSAPPRPPGMTEEKSPWWRERHLLQIRSNAALMEKMETGSLPKLTGPAWLVEDPMDRVWVYRCLMNTSGWVHREVETEMGAATRTAALLVMGRAFPSGVALGPPPAGAPAGVVITAKIDQCRFGDESWLHRPELIKQWLKEPWEDREYRRKFRASPRLVMELTVSFRSTDGRILHVGTYRSGFAMQDVSKVDVMELGFGVKAIINDRVMEQVVQEMFHRVLVELMGESVRDFASHGGAGKTT